MLQESGGNPLALSSAGAFGLMQVEPSHFRPGQNPLDPLTNIMVGVGFLDRLDAMFGGNLPLVAAAYNAGPTAVEDWVSMFDVANWPALSAEPEVQAWSEGQTVAYVTFVLADYERLRGSKVRWLSPAYLPRPAGVEGGGQNVAARG